MSRRYAKAAVTGTHSTGKSTFVALLSARLVHRGLRVARVSDVAAEAKRLGFPILTGHTYESTSWIMAEGLRREAEASLSADVVLVDRPTLDALGYLEAALEVSDRTIDPERLGELRALAVNHTSDYDVVVTTILNLDIPLGEGRDDDARYRFAAAARIDALVAEHAPEALGLGSADVGRVLDAAEIALVDVLSRRRGLTL